MADQASDPAFGDAYPSPADHFERLLRMSFAGVLEGYINSELQSVLAPRGAYLRPIVPQVRCRLLAIEYGSLKQILDVTGIEGADIRDFALKILEIYAPIAFREATGLNVSLHASAVVVAEAPVPTEVEGSKPRMGLEALGKAWIISNVSLIVPVFLALSICFIAFASLMQSVEANRKERADMQSERT